MEIKVSIVIPNFNGRQLLEKNLPKVIAACKNWGKWRLPAGRQGWEVIVVDDASTDDSINFLQNNYPQVKIVRHERNQRFAATCNSGVRAAKGKVVVLLNSDVVPEVNFLKPLVSHFGNNNIFAVGCQQIELRNGKQFYFGAGRMKFIRGLAIHWRAEDQNQTKTDWVFGGAGAFDKEKWLEIGGMDTLFRPAYDEDRDLSYRGMKHGWELLFEPKSQVYHQAESTNIRVFGKTKMKISSFKNDFLFVWKNITDNDYLFKHLLWLPYHLIMTNMRAGGLVLIGFLLALGQLPETIRSRIKVRKLFVRKDCQLI